MRLVQTVILSYFLELLENGIIFFQRKRPDLKDIEVLLELSMAICNLRLAKTWAKAT